MFISIKKIRKLWPLFLISILVVVSIFILNDPRGKLLILKWELGSARNQLKNKNKDFKNRLEPIAKIINAKLADKKNMTCSMQIYRELRWRIDFTIDSKKINERFLALEKSLKDERDQSFADEQSPEDGSWGGCYEEWFMRMWASAEHLNHDKSQAIYPFHFLDRINTPESLTNMLETIIKNDFEKSGEFNRVRIDDTISGIGTLLLKQNTPYHWHPKLKESYLTFLKSWQNPKSGMWGTWFVLPIGPTIKTDDTGTTFHILGQINCNADHLDKLAKTMLKLKTLDFPFGWRVEGKYENHMNWDAVRNFKCAWPSSSEGTRKKIRDEIHKMLHWTLAESLSADGSFKISELDKTPGEAALYGVEFLNEIGFFEKKRRFWSDEEFSNSTAIREKIIKYLRLSSDQNVYTHKALEIISRVD